MSVLGRATAMSTNNIDLHLDELEYTRDGLRGPRDRSLRLEVGVRNVVRLVRPERVQLAEPGVGGFAFNSAFPTPGVLQLLLIPYFHELLHQHAQEGSGPIYQVLGHTDATGDEADNKVVSERRARAVFALLTRNTEMFAQVAHEESWGTAEAQVMLRVLRCDPGPPDGKIGKLTRDAVEDFQHQFNAGIFHRHLGATSPSILEVTGELDADTHQALLDAFVAALSPGLQEAQLHPTHPYVGCSEYNLFNSENDAQNRRVSLAIYDSLPPYHDRAPCTERDHMACPAQAEGSTRCLWYRYHFVEHRPQDIKHRHFDLRWLLLDHHRVMLSALTTLEDGSAVQFRVHRSLIVGELHELDVSKLSEDLSPPLEGKVTSGVAWAVWEYGAEKAELLDPSTWPVALPLDEAIGRNLLEVAARAQFPLFTVTGGDAISLSAPPLRDVFRAVGCPADDPPPPGYVMSLDGFGRVFHTRFDPRTAMTSLRALETDARAAAIRPKMHIVVPSEAR